MKCSICKHYDLDCSTCYRIQSNGLVQCSYPYSGLDVSPDFGCILFEKKDE
jgi:hypothetical protein